jgi:hypothetical protein
VVTFEPSKKQFEAWEYLHDKESVFIGYGGAAFSGKSYLLAWWIVTSALKYNDTAWGVGRKELTNLKKTTLITIFKVLNEVGLSVNDYNYNQQNNTMTFQNGSVIFLIDTAHKPSDVMFERFGGLELTSCAIDESAETSYKAIEILSTRIGRRNNQKHGITPKILETFNPSKNHIYSRYYKPWTNNTITSEYKFVKALPSDNPSVEVAPYVERLLKTADKITVQRLIYGNFEYDDSPNALIDYDSITDLWQNDFVEKGKGYITADIARLGSDKAVVMVWKGLVVVEIVSVAKSKLNELQAIIEALKSKHEIPHSNIIADEDGVGGGVIDFMQIKGFKNGGKVLKKENYLNLKTQCYYWLAKYVNANKIYIEAQENKEEIIQELEWVRSYKIDADTKLRILPKNLIKEGLGRSPDFTDTMMMRMYYEVQPQGTYYVS